MAPYTEYENTTLPLIYFLPQISVHLLDIYLNEIKCVSFFDNIFILVLKLYKIGPHKSVCPGNRWFP